LTSTDTPSASDALQRTIRSALQRVAVVHAVSQIMSLLSLAVLYRLIPPEEYGLLGMVMPLVLLVRCFSTLGLDMATVQRHLLHADEVSSLFWLNLVLGCACALLVAILAPGVAWFYAAPRLVGLSLALAGTSVAFSLGTQHQALLERQLRLGTLALARLTGNLAACGAALACAWAGWGVWALVAQQYAELIVLAAFVWCAEPWRPGAPGRGVSQILEHLRLGSWFAASGVLFFLAANLDKVLVGRLLDARALGLYSQAFALMAKLVAVVMTPLSGIVLTSLSRAREAGRPAQTALLAGFYRAVTIVLWPAGVGLALVGSQAMVVLGGAEWKDAGPLLSALSWAILGLGFIQLGVPVFASAGHTDRLFRAALLYTIVVLLAYLVGWWFGVWWGSALLGVAVGFTVAVLAVLLVPYSLFCLRSSGFATRPVLVAVRRPARAALVMGCVVWMFQQLVTRRYSLPPLASLTADVAVGVAVYAWLARAEIRWLVANWFRSAP
jgi:PST family polysaccharide transporter